jgi:pimeloyl-ACP methyl ester carboxylesterase
MTDLYVEWDGGGRPGVVLVHAGIADLRMWDRQVATLAPRHRVVRYDVRGSGRSPDPVGDHFDHDDLLAVMDASGLDRAVLVGASNGGRIVLDTAVSAPGRVIGIVLLNASVPGVPMSDALRADLSHEDEALLSGDIERAKEMNLRWFVDGVDRDPADADPRVRAVVGGWLDDLLPRQAAQLRTDAGDAQLIEPPVRDRLDDLPMPALVITGRHDDPGLRAAARHVADHMPRAELVELDGAAHLPNLERPDRVDALLMRFLAAVGRDPETPDPR